MNTKRVERKLAEVHFKTLGQDALVQCSYNQTDINLWVQCNGFFGSSDFRDHKRLNEADHNILLEEDFYYNYNYIFIETNSHATKSMK